MLSKFLNRNRFDAMSSVSLLDPTDSIVSDLKFGNSGKKRIYVSLTFGVQICRSWSNFNGERSFSAFGSISQPSGARPKITDSICVNFVKALSSAKSIS